jgi:adenosylhomocysteine nucleosidase
MVMLNLKAGIQSETSKVLIAAALARELSPLRRTSHPNVTLLKTGEGPSNASRALKDEIERARPAIVVAIGYAGALSEDLEIGDLVLVNRLIGCGWALSPDLLGLARRVRMDSVRLANGVSVDRIVSSRREKLELARRLGDGRTAVVDMESAAIAEVCSPGGLPLLIVRAITDRLDEDLPIDFNRCRTDSGRLSNLKVLGQAAGRASALKGLWELKRRAQFCSARLAEFAGRLIPLLDEGDRGF